MGVDNDRHERSPVEMCLRDPEMDFAIEREGFEDGDAIPKAVQHFSYILCFSSLISIN